jgi:hypothetical protein
MVTVSPRKSIKLLTKIISVIDIPIDSSITMLDRRKQRKLRNQI